MFSGDMYVAELRLPSVVSLLENSLKELARFPQAVEIRKLLSSWTEDASPQDKHRTCCAVYPSIQEEAAVISSLRGPKSRAPKLGGATRWLVDKFECISYIRDHMLAIYNFVADELSRSKTTPCNAIHSMYNIMNADSLKRDGQSHVDALILQADDFLAKTGHIRSALAKMSDSWKTPQATAVNNCLEMVKAQQGRFLDAYNKGITRLSRKHDMNFWWYVSWMDPIFELGCPNEEEFYFSIKYRN
eukprot:PhM_4_TR2091/c1_g2_i3/m.35943